MQDNIEYVDKEDGLKRVMGNEALYTRMLNMFLDSDEFEKMENAIAEKNIQKMAEVMHAIKGMTGNLSLAKLFEISSKLSEEFKTGEFDQSMVDEYRLVLKNTIEAVKAII